MGKGQFITTEFTGNGGERGEFRVWERVQDAFGERACLAYWRYPLFSPQGKHRKEPDILILDRQLGIIVIEVKSLRIHQITQITGHRWHYQGFYQKTGSPYQQAEQQVWAILRLCEREPGLTSCLMSRAIVALPYITQEQWHEKQFDRLVSAPPILFENHLRLTAIAQFGDRVKKISPLTPGTSLSQQQWQLLLSLMSGTPIFQPNPSSRWRLYPSPSRAEILAEARQQFSQLDLAQETLAKTIPPGVQRIRGIAGSGKTVILCQKAAHMHLKHPDWKIAIVFFSRSLYQTITEQLDRWLRHFSDGQVGYSSRDRNLRVFHGWGAKGQPGFYRFLCRLSGVSPRTVADTLQSAPHEALSEVCIDLLHRGKIPQIFDAVFMDEGQDFLVKDSMKFEQKQPFYWLAYQSLHSCNPLHPEQRRLIWTMDEYQHLDPQQITTVIDLFGAKLGHLLNGVHLGNIAKTEILCKSYRTPAQVLRVAYGIVMGIFRPQGCLTQLCQKSDWQALGFEVEGKLLPGNSIALTRPFDTDLNPVSQLASGALIEFHSYESRQEELANLGDRLRQNLRQDGLKPSRDILVILLGTRIQTRQLEPMVVEALLRQGIDVYLPGQKQDSGLKNSFWFEGCVTVSSIEKAKGNEADMVYAIALDRIAQDESNLSLRNHLFIALTRTRAWVTISGVGNYSLYQEFHQLLKPQNSLTFTLPQQSQRSLSITDISEVIDRYTAGDRNFQGMNLKGAQLPGINLSQANFIRTEFQQANLENAQLQGTKFIFANLSQTNLRGANLRQAKLMGANLSEAQLEGADLTHADLSDANLDGAQF
ncbi:MAG: pentapeptide repeat-containing protein [Roseofilum sp. SID3]|uniref:pentapeptide repeat-containing protein n=1 Tax=Roseofilum sp. SID3 TaxID=2821499 RepID=UPI001B1D1077|nr:pentapeptide repeat-containing protein [Roseofilum sp. SID3]MBP0011930.1 pentapeptide repeat-containing protein [Roseofilum sp. SID3]